MHPYLPNTPEDVQEMLGRHRCGVHGSSGSRVFRIMSDCKKI